MATLDDAIEAIRLGDREEGRQILEGLLEGDEGNEQVWLWLSTVVDGDEDREVCLENVLAINSANGIAQRGLDALRAGRFNPRDLMSEALGGVEEEEPAGATFLDEFRRNTAEDEDSDDDEIVLRLAEDRTALFGYADDFKRQTVYFDFAPDGFAGVEKFVRDFDADHGHVATTFQVVFVDVPP